MAILSFYEKPALLDRERHKKVRLKASPKGFRFAASTIAIPITPVEFTQAVLEFPILFALNENGPGTPIGLFGIREKENLFVSQNGQWQGNYVPAFVRRYPFLLNIDPATKTPMVMVDEAFDGLSTTEGEPLFEADGSEAEALKNALTFLNDFKAQGDFATEFMEKLKKHDLLIPQSLSFKGEGEGDLAQSFSLNGFHIVDEKRLAALSDEVTLELARSGDLGRIYAHLLSLNNVNKLTRRLAARIPKKTTA